MIIWSISTTSVVSATSSYSSSKSQNLTQNNSSIILNNSSQFFTYTDITTETGSGSTRSDGLWTSFHEIGLTINGGFTTTLDAGGSTGINSTSILWLQTSAHQTGTTTKSSSLRSTITDGTTTASASASTSNTTHTSFTYQLETTTTSSYTSTGSSTSQSNSSYRITSASSIASTLSDGNTSLSITTFTSSVSQTTIRSTVTTFTLTRKSISFVAGTNTNFVSSFAFISVVEAGPNEIAAIPISNISGANAITSNFTTFTGSSTFQPVYSFSQAVTWTLATITATAVGFPSKQSGISSIGYTRPSSSSLTISLIADNITTTTTLAISSSVRPYTSSFTIRKTTSFYLSSSTLTTQSSSFFINIPTFITTVTVSNTVTFSSFTANFRTSVSSFSFESTAILGWITMTTSSAIIDPGNLDTLGSIVHTGFSTQTTSTTSNTDLVFDSVYFSSVTFFTFAASNNYQTNDSPISISDVGENNIGILYRKSYVSGTAFLIPVSDFSTLNPGTNLAPNFPVEYIIPATYASRADGPAVPLSSTGSTILTYLRNTTGGFGTSVNSSLYTTFSWEYSSASLSVTTQTTFTSLNGANTDTATSSSSTSTILDVVASATTAFDFSILQFTSLGTVLNSTNTKQALPLGRLQKYTDITFMEKPVYILGTSYDENRDSSTYSEILSIYRSRIISSNTSYSIEEIAPFYYVRAGSMIAIASTITFARNFRVDDININLLID